MGGAYNGSTDGCHDRTITWIDSMGISPSTITSLQKEHLNLEDKILVYPNPSNGIIHILSPEYSFSNYQLFDAQGRLIKSEIISSSEIEIKKKGLYFLKLMDLDERRAVVITKRVLIM